VPVSRESTLRAFIDWLVSWSPLFAGATLGISLRLVYSGKPMAAFDAMSGSFFVLVPMVVGAVAVYLAERKKRRNWGLHFLIGFGANALFVLGTLLFMIEGVICAFFATPVFGFLGGVAGIVMGQVCHRLNRPRPIIFSLAALPLLTGGIEQYLSVPDAVTCVERTRLVATSPDQVWAQLVNAPDIRPEEIGQAWMYRIGVPLPAAATTHLSDGQYIRHITMGKGIHFDQVAQDWEPGHRVRWLYRFTPDSFPPRALDEHVRIGGRYFDLIDTEYSLQPVSAGTQLQVRITYRVSTAFNWYSERVASVLVGNFEEAALGFYANRASRARASLSRYQAGATNSGSNTRATQFQ
jgi:hypothetical protein